MKIFLRLAWFFKLHWQHYAIAIAALATIALLVMVPPWLTGRIVDAIANRSLTSTLLLSHVSAMMALAVIIYALRYMWRILLYSSSYRLAALLSQRLYVHFMLMSQAFYQHNKTGDLMARATNDVRAVEATAGEGVLSLFDGLLTGLVVISVLFIGLSWKLALIALLPWPLMAYFMWRFGNELHSAFALAQARFSELNECAQESVTSVRLLKAFGQEDLAAQQFSVVATRTNAANLAVASVEAKYDPTIFLTVGTSFLLTVAGGAWLITLGEMTIGQLTSFTMYLGFLIWPMFAFGWLLNVVERGSAAYERIQEILHTPKAFADAGTATAITHSTIQFSIDAFRYPAQETNALTNIHLSVPAGHTLGVVGPVGAGKTTLVNLLLRNYQAEHESIFIGNKPLSDYSLRALRDAIAVVPQDPFLFSTTLRDNIALSRPDADMAAIRAAARAACIDDEIMALPNGYDTLVGERGITLSGGQKQRIAIARALLCDAPILILDDTLSAVDVKTEKHILEHLRHYSALKTTLIISHRLSAVAHADSIIVLTEGKVYEVGTHAALLANNNWYAQTYRYQQIEQAVADEQHT